MAIVKVYINIRTQVITEGKEGVKGVEKMNGFVIERMERLASGFMEEDEAKTNVQLAKDVLEKIFHDAEFVED